MINTCVSTAGNVQMERRDGGEWRNGREGKGWEKREAKRRDWEGGEGVKGSSASINQCTNNETSGVVHLVFCDGLQQGLSVRVDGETLARLEEGGDDISIQALEEYL